MIPTQSVFLVLMAIFLKLQYKSHFYYLDPGQSIYYLNDQLLHVCLLSKPINFECYYFFRILQSMQCYELRAFLNQIHPQMVIRSWHHFLENRLNLDGYFISHASQLLLPFSGLAARNQIFCCSVKVQISYYQYRHQNR